ncbi:peptide deformylase [Paenibacillus phoenicis]|jgi:peptide deformylase|uniref:Peptide deformylase n=2 Tax=Paenibacillus TaxID=44249 RepID=A0ABY1LVR7_9BACL|nr:MULTISPECIES: peptide deformylase [Paenibacillus]EES72832.1 peptide deformylase [Paenibacillus sp. oral taxon 786 str. D14]MCT2195610.1 peptide deformylase [Paenibacillus sp. p3-SID1389]MDU0333013.1 peptide deformylase [Paenibacillus sp. 3LSP]MEA3570101.1 peptide deformylase [Paenibacillus phoenicis]MEC2345735.1 peptide deformylase [Paenibacillus barengoltzii]
MAIRIIVKEPDEVLHQVAKEVKKITPNIQKLLTDMADTMYDAEGVGLAAPQIGILKRVIVVDVGDEHGLIELINPEIVSKEGEQFGPEGCLSIPGYRGDVRRAMTVTVKGLDRNGNEVTYTGSELLARAFQHEIDHLNGVLYTDIAERVYEITPEGEEKE